MKLAIRTVCFHFLCILIFGIIYYNIQYQFQHNDEQQRKSILDYILLSTTIQAGVGFSEQEIKNYTQTKSQDLINGGFSINEVNNYFGIKEPDTTLIEEYWKESVNEVITDKEYQSFNDPNTPFATTAQLSACISPACQCS